MLIFTLAVLQSPLCLTAFTTDLSLYDLSVLRDDGWLSANHIAAANKLMVNAFPCQNGLQDTHYVAERMSWLSTSKNFIQNYSCWRSSLGFYIKYLLWKQCCWTLRQSTHWAWWHSSGASEHNCELWKCWYHYKNDKCCASAVWTQLLIVCNCSCCWYLFWKGSLLVVWRRDDEESPGTVF